MLKVDDKEERGRWWVFGGRGTEEGRLFWGGSSLKQMGVIFNVFLFVLYWIQHSKKKKRKKKQQKSLQFFFFLVCCWTCIVPMPRCRTFIRRQLVFLHVSFRFCFCFVALFPHLLFFLFSCEVISQLMIETLNSL